MHRTRRNRIALLLAVTLTVVLAAACAPGGPGAIETPTAIPVLTAELPTTPTTEPTLAPPTVTPTPDIDVAPEALDDLPSAPEAWEPLEEWLSDAWDVGCDPAAVQAALRGAGWQGETEELVLAVLDDPARPYWVLPLIDLPTLAADEGAAIPLFGLPGTLWIVGEGGVLYRHHYGVDALGREPGMLPEVTAVADLTGDGLDEVVIQNRECGAHTCYGYFQIVGWADGHLQNLVMRHDLSEDMIVMSFPEPRIDTYQGEPAFFVQGGTIGSVGAGIMRGYTEAWSWDGTGIIWRETILDPTSYRHHILYEGIDRMEAGDLDGAAILFQDAVHDAELETVPFADDDPFETELAIEQYALFRLILIDLLQGNEEPARWRLQQMSDEPAVVAMTEAAEMLIERWRGPEHARPLCTEIADAIEDAHVDPTGPLAYQGYGNPSLTAHDLCFLQQP